MIGDVLERFFRFPELALVRLDRADVIARDVSFRRAPGRACAVGESLECRLVLEVLAGKIEVLTRGRWPDLRFLNLDRPRQRLLAIGVLPPRIKQIAEQENQHCEPDRSVADDLLLVLFEKRDGLAEFDR